KLMRKVRGPALKGPILHGGGDGVSDDRIERHALLDGLFQRFVNRLGQPLALHVFVENVNAEQILDVGLAEIDAMELMLSASDVSDRFLANGGHGNSSRGTLNLRRGGLL